MNETTKGMLSFILILAAFTSVMIVGSWAILNWHGTVIWTVQTKTFEVYDSDGTTLLATDWLHDLGTILPGYTFEKTFYLKNTGNTELTVIVSGTPNGCDASWDSQSYTITPSGSLLPATLTITVTGEGSYDFTFDVQP